MCGPEPPAGCLEGCAQCQPEVAETGAWPAAYRDPDDAEPAPAEAAWVEPAGAVRLS